VDDDAFGRAGVVDSLKVDGVTRVAELFGLDDYAVLAEVVPNGVDVRFGDAERVAELFDVVDRSAFE
jgi:hypothetical protein